MSPIVGLMNPIFRTVCDETNPFCSRSTGGEYAAYTGIRDPDGQRRPTDTRQAIRRSRRVRLVGVGRLSADDTVDENATDRPSAPLSSGDMSCGTSPLWHTENTAYAATRASESRGKQSRNER